MSEIPKKKWAALYANKEFVCVMTLSGLRISAFDPTGAVILLEPNPTADALGQALQQALSRSRVLKPEQLDELFAPAARDKNYDDWVTSLMQKFGYRSRRELFKHMKLCNVTSVNGAILIVPTDHEKLEGWAGLDTDEHLTIEDLASAQQLGDGALLALSRCTGQ